MTLLSGDLTAVRGLVPISFRPLSFLIMSSNLIGPGSLLRSLIVDAFDFLNFIDARDLVICSLEKVLSRQML